MAISQHLLFDFEALMKTLRKIDDPTEIADRLSELREWLNALPKNLEEDYPELVVPQHRAWYACVVLARKRDS